MPQLDKITYATQIFWLLISFISFYLYILKNILPAILGNISIRETIINDSLNQIKEADIAIQKKKQLFIALMSQYHIGISKQIGEVSNLLKIRFEILGNTYVNLKSISSISKNILNLSFIRFLINKL